MGALWLEGWGRRPQGKGCLLLAVAGATSLVTLLLAVPITVLAVRALVPQEPGGGLVTRTADPGMQAQAQQRLGSQELPEEEAEADFSSRLPAAHLIGAWTKGQGLGWEAKKEEAFLRSGTLFSGAEGLALPRDGLYYLYCHVGYRGRAPPAGRGPPDPPVTLRSRLFRAGGAYGPGSPELLLEGAETVTPAPGPARPREYGPLWYTSVGFGGLVQLRRGERVYVNISHPDMVDYRRGKTFFGAVMVG
ncbi:lymphotoxin-beta [Canis lupus familiaris]|uniref:Lymphotoxin-beta n=3 Tax=Canis lupus TaxID=9612 RepID=J9P2Z1_CANLF|nr:lymphotoxin-beta [Canis lupus familiaris]XP_025273947.3 lymphotoxin-beta isoform X1 [Canis lupus dingo]CTQ86234.1 TPA: tumor necrosis factor ligand 1C [Canis lupus familiaris]|eukprot:NP_001028682.1 lymphotoxin-beta [Canis lupus familiaris]